MDSHPMHDMILWDMNSELERRYIADVLYAIALKSFLPNEIQLLAEWLSSNSRYIDIIYSNCCSSRICKQVRTNAYNRQETYLSTYP